MVLPLTAFAVQMNDELIIRSVSGIDLTSNTISFFSDMSFGETIHLVKVKDISRHTNTQFKQFGCVVVLKTEVVLAYRV